MLRETVMNELYSVPRSSVRGSSKSAAQVASDPLYLNTPADDGGPNGSGQVPVGAAPDIQVQAMYTQPQKKGKKSARGAAAATATGAGVGLATATASSMTPAPYKNVPI